MAENTTKTILGGKYEMSIGTTLIPAEVLGDITVTYTEGTREAQTQAGVRKQGSGVPETAEAKFVMYLTSMDDMKALFADAYKAPVGDLQKTGSIAFGSGSCSTKTTLPINIHPICEKTDDDDIFVPAGLIQANVNLTLSTSDLLNIEVTVDMQPSDEGYVRFGTGDVSQPSIYDVTTGKTVPVSDESGA